MGSAEAFVEAELRGVEGMRYREMLGRWLEEGGEEAELAEAIRRAGWAKRRELDGFNVYWPRWSDLPVERSLRRLIGHREWARFFGQLCESGPKRMAAQVCQFRDELAERGADHALADVEDALFDFAARWLPESPAGEASEEGFADWAVELWRKALRHANDLYRKGRAVDTALLTDEGMEALWGKRAAYRAEVRRRVMAATKATRSEGRSA